MKENRVTAILAIIILALVAFIAWGCGGVGQNLPLPPNVYTLRLQMVPELNVSIDNGQYGPTSTLDTYTVWHDRDIIFNSRYDGGDTYSWTVQLSHFQQTRAGTQYSISLLLKNGRRLFITKAGAGRDEIQLAWFQGQQETGRITIQDSEAILRSHLAEFCPDNLNPPSTENAFIDLGVYLTERGIGLHP